MWVWVFGCTSTAGRPSCPHCAAPSSPLHWPSTHPADECPAHTPTAAVSHRGEQPAGIPEEGCEADQCQVHAGSARRRLQRVGATARELMQSGGGGAVDAVGGWRTAAPRDSNAKGDGPVSAVQCRDGSDDGETDRGRFGSATVLGTVLRMAKVVTVAGITAAVRRVSRSALPGHERVHHPCASKPGLTACHPTACSPSETSVTNSSRSSRTRSPMCRSLRRRSGTKPCRVGDAQPRPRFQRPAPSTLNQNPETSHARPQGPA